MTKSQILANLKLGTAPIAFGLALMAVPAAAQSTDPSQQQDTAPQGPAVGVPNPADATGEPTTQAQQGGDIIVTGSRIPQPNLTAVSPVSVITSEEFKVTGTTRTEDLLNQLPQVFADQGSSVSNGSTGTATVNLRNLGSNRTLVLVNGRRLVPGDPFTSSAADLNFIPATLVKRVDVLTGGASSTYGADAIGGVVNFIMDTDFTGFRLDGQYSLYQHDNRVGPDVRNALNRRGFGFPDGPSANGGTVDVTGTIGASLDDNRGHVVAYAGYRRVNAVNQSTRDYSACQLTPTATGVNCGGSGTSPNGTVFAFTGGAPGDIFTDPVTMATRPVPFSGGTSSTFQIGPNRTLIGGRTLYNFQPLNYFQRPDERYTLGFFANYEVNDAIKPYLEGMFMDDRTVAQIAPSGDFGNTLSVNCDNPLLSAQQSAIICNQGNLFTDPSGSTVTSDAQGGVVSAPFTFIDPTTGLTYNRGAFQLLRRNVEGGPRRDDLQHTAYRIVAGVRGDLNPAFSYDGYFQFGRTNLAETYFNDVSISRLTNALDVVAGPGGTPICRVTQADPANPCVPYDIFAQGAVSPAALGYLSVPGFQRAQNEEQVASVSVTGLLGEYGIKSPFADDGVGVNVGAEYRKEKLNLATDLEFQTGDLAGQGAATLPVNGSYRVYEAFGEIRVPLVHDSFIYDLSFEGGYRYSNYKLANRSFNTDTYKVGGEIAPVRSIRFRGAYNRSVRSPNLQEFFAPRRVVLDGSTDPCSDFVITAADAGCLAQGLSIGQTVNSNPANQYNGLIGGNPNLDPEIADTYTAGVVLQPDFVPFLNGLAVTVDYFDIRLKRTIQGLGADTILATCTATADPTLCGLINRDQFGSLYRTPNGFVVDTTQNIGSLKTRGIDVGASYARSLGGLGSLSMNFNGTYLDQFRVDNGTSTPYDCSGLYGAQCGTPLPRYRHKLRATVTTPSGIGLSGAWRYFDSVKQDITSSNPTLAATPANPVRPFNARIPVQSFFDLAMTATVGEHYNFRLGVNNILDRQPPLVGGSACPAGFCNGNTYPVVYDALGRYLYAGLTLDF